MRRISLALATTLGLAPSAWACDVALLLAVDISGSVDPAEYRLQRDGLAAALRDGVVAEALVRANARVALMQWTGSSRQKVTVPWTATDSFAAVERLAQQVAADARIWRNFSTAIGEALTEGARYLAQVPGCKRKVIDVSGDGISNEGLEPSQVRAGIAALGITVNGLVIETDQTDLTGYFFENVIAGPGAFVVTANGFEEYPERIRLKLMREITDQLAAE